MSRLVFSKGVHGEGAANSTFTPKVSVIPLLPGNVTFPWYSFVLQ